MVETIILWYVSPRVGINPDPWSAPNPYYPNHFNGFTHDKIKPKHTG